jgi:hypothetical protein
MKTGKQATFHLSTNGPWSHEWGPLHIFLIILKWILIGLVEAFGLALGFIGWVDAIILIAMEWAVRLVHLYKGSLEVGEAAKKVGEAFKNEK